MTTILSIIPYQVFPAKLGGQKGIALFNEYLAKECTLICVTVKSNLPGYAKGYELLNILSNQPHRYTNPLYFFKIAKLIRQKQVTHLLLEHPYFGWLGVFLKWFTGVKLIIHSHNIETTRWKSLGKWWWRVLFLYERFAHRHADFNFFIQDEDRQYAIQKFKLIPGKCTTITYGIEWNKPPTDEEKMSCRQLLAHEKNINPAYTIYLFNGTLDYKPNLDAVRIILDKITPELLKTSFNYKIIICGRGLPDSFDQLKLYADKNIIYAGFVDDITIYFKGADVFINPIIDGGGIKTKLVEALGYNTPAVSTTNGSVGVAPSDTNGLLQVVQDNDWKDFVTKMLEAPGKPKIKTPSIFYEKFFW